MHATQLQPRISDDSGPLLPKQGAMIIQDGQRPFVYIFLISHQSPWDNDINSSSSPEFGSAIAPSPLYTVNGCTKWAR